MSKWSNGKLATAFYEDDLKGKTVHGTLRVHHFKSCSFLVNSDGDGDKVIAMRFPFAGHSSGGVTLWEKDAQGRGRHKTIGRFKTSDFQQQGDKILVKFSDLQENTYEDITSSRLVAYRDQCAILHIAGHRWLLYCLPTPAEGFRTKSQFTSDICEGSWTTMSLLTNGVDDIDNAIEETIPKDAKVYYHDIWFEETSDYIPGISEEEWETLQNEPNIFHYMKTPDLLHEIQQATNNTRFKEDIQIWNEIHERYKIIYNKDPWTKTNLTTGVKTPIIPPQFRKKAIEGVKYPQYWKEHDWISYYRGTFCADEKNMYTFQEWHKRVPIPNTIDLWKM